MSANVNELETIEAKTIGPIKKLYFKILESCNSRFAPYLLGILSFTESCCFIIPPEVMLLPMSYANRKRAFRYALITTVTSVLGAIAGYYLGMLFWDIFQPYAFSYIPGFASNFDKVGDLYQQNAALALFIAAFTPIPFKVFTVVAGVYSAKISLTLLIVMSIIGRGSRYYILSALVYFFGPKAHELIEKHFTAFTIVVGLLSVALALFLKFK